MKATQRDFSSKARAAARNLRIAWLCGPDEGGAWAGLVKLAALLPDPGERIELAGAALRADPARLGDEARSTSLFGGARHIVVRTSGDEAFEAVRTYCELIDAGAADGGCPVLMVATSATDKARTAKLLGPRDDALVAMFYPPDFNHIVGEVRSMAEAAGVTLTNELAGRIARASGLDVRLAQAEVTKLALYLDASPTAPRKADAEALDAIGAATEDDSYQPLVNAVLMGRLDRLAGELRRMRELSLNPVGVVLAFERQVVQLAGPGRPGIPQHAAKDLESQRRIWTARRLDRLVPRLAALHRRLMGNSQAAELLLAQELTEIARFAGSTQ